MINLICKRNEIYSDKIKKKLLALSSRILQVLIFYELDAKFIRNINELIFYSVFRLLNVFL